jgi:hypothetical protein
MDGDKLVALPQLAEVEFPEVVDATFMNEWRACRHKAFRGHMQHYKPEGESVHLHFGACFAAGLEAARRQFYIEGKGQDESLGMGMRAFLESWGDYIPPDYVAKTLERGLGALEFYFAEWPLGDKNQAVPRVMPSGTPAIEFSFAQPLPFLHPVTREPVLYVGRSDMIADFAEGVYIEDDKTASQLGDSWAKQWELRGQFTGYCWAARESGIDTNGVLVRGVSILKTKYGAAQALTNRSATEIDEWLATTLDDLADLRTAWEKREYKKNFGDTCSSYGGCQFVPVCKSPDPDTWLKVYFVRSRWDPIERTNTLLD